MSDQSWTDVAMEDDDDYFLDDAEDYDDDDGFDEDEEEGSLFDDASPGLQVAGMALDEPRVEILTGEEAVEVIAHQVDQVSSVLAMDFTTTSVLLKALRWNGERLLEQYFEDPDKVIKQAKVLVRDDGADVAPVYGDDCMICGEEGLTAETASALGCGHVFCNDCWQGHITCKVGEGVAIGIPCMAHQCPAVVNETLVRRVCPPDIVQRYTYHFCRSVVDDHPRLRWCPAPGCNLIARAEMADDVRCKCGYAFCFRCGSEAHLPATCECVKKWLTKCQDDSETFNWISANTKDCPKCKTAIEKNGGCNHMTCRKCNFGFCWLCLSDINNHTQCNRYDESKADQNESRASLERYLFYFNRYSNHAKSIELESETRMRSLERMEDLQQTDKTWVDVQYISMSTEQCIAARKTLKYTYVHAYYMEASQEKDLFEWLQADLEASTEALSLLLESETLGETEESRRELLDAGNLVERRHKHLLDGIRNGLTGDQRMTVTADVKADDKVSAKKAVQTQSSQQTKKRRGR